MPGGHRSALGLRCRVGRCWTSATGRQHPRRQPRPLLASSMPQRFSPSPPVTPPQACAALWHKRRRGDTAECLRCQFAPMAARSARAHREDSTRSRRGMVLNSLRLVFSHLSGGVWRRPAPRPLRKISPPNGGARGLLFFAAFCGVTCGD